MKRNSKLMRASGILLVLTLITSCFVGVTFAKYVSEDEITDKARVAKWGVTVTAIDAKTTVEGEKGDSGEPLQESTFLTSYKKGDSNVQQTENGADMSYTVVSSLGLIGDPGEDAVLAPGTSGEFSGITISGEPEVAVEIVTDAEVTLSSWVDDAEKIQDCWVDENGNFYCPLVFTIGDKEICGLEFDSGEGGRPAFEDAIERAIEDTTNRTTDGQSKEDGSTYYPAGTRLDDISVSYSWKWPFAGSEVVIGGTEDYPQYGDGHRLQNDISDTNLGSLISYQNDDKLPTITIEVTTTVSQVN